MIAAAFGDNQQPLSFTGNMFHISRFALDLRNELPQIFNVCWQSFYGHIRIVHAEIVLINSSFIRGVVGMFVLQVLTE